MNGDLEKIVKDEEKIRKCRVRGLFLKRFRKRPYVLFVREKKEIMVGEEVKEVVDEYYTLPGGKIDCPNSNITAFELYNIQEEELKRELKEELGLFRMELVPFGSVIPVFGAGPSNCFSMDIYTEFIHSVLSFDKPYKGEIKANSKEIAEVRWISMRDISGRKYPMRDITLFQVYKTLKKYNFFNRNCFISQDLSNGYREKINNKYKKFK
jgi:8-oxo-dGTP pyrophosphatase MutT (NUDIX family)